MEQRNIPFSLLLRHPELTELEHDNITKAIFFFFSKSNIEDLISKQFQNQK